MKVKSKRNGEIYNANISGTGWHVWTTGYDNYCSDKVFAENYIILRRSVNYDKEKNVQNGNG